MTAAGQQGHRLSWKQEVKGAMNGLNSRFGSGAAVLRRLWIVAVVLLALGNSTASARPSGDVWGSNYFPNHELTAHTGEILRFFDDVIAGRVVAINFIFTRCTDVCPMETARMKEVYRLLGDRVGKDVFFYSITIDPERDTVPVLKDYVNRYGIDGSKWKFLTGDKKQIDEIRNLFGLYSTPREEADLSNHNISLMIGNQATGQWIKRSPFENPYVLADQLGSWLHNWKTVSRLTKSNYAQAPKLRQISPGEMMFRDRCSSCHVISGNLSPARNAPKVGPDLFAVHERRHPSWLRRWLAEPDAMLSEGDPIAVAMYDQYKVIMPNFRLDESEIGALIDYLTQETLRLRARQIGLKDHTSHVHDQYHPDNAPTPKVTDAK